MSVELDVSLWKSISKIGVQFLIIFTFFINVFMKTLANSIIYFQTVPLDRLLMYIVKILCLWKSTSKIGVQFLIIFTFFINVFMKTLANSIIYFQTVPLDRLLMYIVKILCQVSLPSLLTWVSLAIFCFRSMLNENCWSAQHLCHWSLVGDKPLVHELSVMRGSCWATCKCNILCPTSCI